MSTKISEISQLFSVGTVESTKKEQTGNVSVRFSNLLQQSTGQATQDFTKQLDKNTASGVPDYAQYQRKETSVKEVQPVTLEEKMTKIEDKMSEYGDAVKEVLKEELGVSEEEIEQAMAGLGLQYADLTNQTNLAQLVSELTGENVTDLLCNESFVNVMQEVSVLTDDMLQELGMNLQEFQDICKQADTLQDFVKPADTEENAAPAEQLQEMAVATDETAVNPDEVTVVADDVPTETATQNVSTEQPTTAQEKAGEQITVVKETQPEKTETVTEDTPGEKTTEVATTVAEEANTDSSNAESGQKQPDMSREQTAQHAEVYVAQGQQTENVQTVQGEFVQAYQQVIDVQDVMEQIVQSARVITTSSDTTMEMQLNPENLGKIFMEITTKEGTVSAKIVAQNEAVRDALEAQIVELKQNLNQAGVKVDAVEVTVSSHEFERNLEQNGKQDEQLAEQREEQEQSGERRRRNLNLNSLDELSGIMTEEESLVAQMMQDNGNTMDVKA